MRAVAAALADAELLGDVKAAEKHGITTRTLRRWRAAADEDVSAMAASTVREVRSEVFSDYREHIEKALSAIIEHIHWAAQVPQKQGAKPSALMVQALAGAMRALHELRQPSAQEARSAAPTVIQIVEAAGPAAKSEPGA